MSNVRQIEFLQTKKANFFIARNFLTTTMIKNTKCAGIIAAAGTRLTHTLMRFVVNSIINYPGPKTQAAHKIRYKL